MLPPSPPPRKKMGEEYCLKLLKIEKNWKTVQQIDEKVPWESYEICEIFDGDLQDLLVIFIFETTELFSDLPAYILYFCIPLKENFWHYEWVYTAS